MSTDLIAKLRNELLSRFSLVPSDQWLDNFMITSRNPAHPLQVLTSTAHFRLLVTDFTTSLSSTRGQILPRAVSDVNAKETVLTGDVPVQVLDIQDIGTSRWSQIEAIERVERGEEIRGREVIRNVPSANEDDEAGRGQDQTSTAHSTALTSNQPSSSRKGSTGPHKLLVQDSAGNKVWAFELARIDRITIINTNPPMAGGAGTSQTSVEGMQIGCKLLLKKGTKVRRGMIMISPANVNILGGRVELWDKKWREGRKARLKQELEQVSSSD